MGPPRPALTALLGGTVVLIFVQAVLAGGFISGTSNTREAHVAVGSLLPWYSLVPAVVSVTPSRSPVGVGVRTTTWALASALWVQMVLGHLPDPGATAVHVPLGVTLFGVALLLAAASARPARKRSRPPGATSGDEFTGSDPSE